MPIYDLPVLTGSGDPSTVTPISLGQIYKDTSTNNLWIANSVTEGGFLKVGSGDAPAPIIVDSNCIIFFDFNGLASANETGETGTGQAGSLILTQNGGVPGASNVSPMLNYIDDGYWRQVGDTDDYFSQAQTFFPGTGEMTLEMVFKTHTSISGGANHHVFCNQIGSSGSANEAGFFIAYGAGANGQTILTSSTGSLVFSKSNLGINTADTWYHYVFTRDSANRMRIAVSTSMIDDFVSFEANEPTSAVISSADITPTYHAFFGARNFNGSPDSFQPTKMAWHRVSNIARYQQEGFFERDSNSTQHFIGFTSGSTDYSMTGSGDSANTTWSLTSTDSTSAESVTIDGVTKSLRVRTFSGPANTPNYLGNDNASWNPCPSNSDWCIDFLINFNDVSLSDSRIMGNLSATASNDGLDIRLTPTILEARLFPNSTSPYQMTLTHSGSLSTGTWYHCALQFDDSSNTCKFGIKQGSLITNLSSGGDCLFFDENTGVTGDFSGGGVLQFRIGHVFLSTIAGLQGKFAEIRFSNILRY